MSEPKKESTKQVVVDESKIKRLEVSEVDDDSDDNDSGDDAGRSQPPEAIVPPGRPHPPKL
jgi:hypothetical protein